MNFENINTAACKLTWQNSDGTPVTGCDTQTDEACLDYEYAADHPEVCPDAPTITGLYVTPVHATIEVGGDISLKAFLQFSNGKEKDVTSVATWQSNYGAVAVVVDSSGKVTGSAVGIASVMAVYRGFSDYSEITVEAACTQAAIDVALVIDRSDSMMTVGLDGKTRLARSVGAAKGLLSNLRFQQGDRASVISFAGIYDPQTSGSPIRSASGTTHISLSANIVDISLALDSITISDCSFVNSSGITGSRCATGMGQGLKLASDDFDANGGDNRKVIVLLTDGMENICSPDPADIAQDLEDDDFTIIVIALGLEDTDVVDCSGDTVSLYDYLQDIATCDMFYTADEPNDLLEIYANIPKDICHGNLEDDCFYYIPPVAPPAVQPCYRDRLDYTGFLNWTVIGKVDLVGRDLFATTWPGEGPFVDLVGTDVARWAVDQSTDACGALQSIEEFTFEPGSYKLSMELAGSKNQVGRTGDEVLVQVGSLVHTTVPLAWNAAFATYEFPFSVNKTTKARILIKQYKVGGQLAPVFNTTIGNYVKTIVLTNEDTDEVLLTDDFDAEGVC